MLQRILLFGGLLAGVLLTAWLLQALGSGPAGPGAAQSHDPDYYMEDFTTLTMDKEGRPKNKLHALYMAHYAEDDTSELLKPQMKFYRHGKPPLYISADKGWVTSANNVVVLKDHVRMWENDAAGKPVLRVTTSQVRILIKEEYAETDQRAKIVWNRTTIIGTGMRAYMKTSRLDVIHHEKTIIEPKPAG
jgi:lipopolysaccharide export system protein LptC